MKKEYKKPIIGILPIKCHVSTLGSDKPKEMNRPRRSLLKKVGLTAAVGHITLYGASQSDQGW